MNSTTKITSICFVIAVIILLASAFYTGLTQTTYTLKSSKLSKGQELTIVLLSDLHGTIHGTNQQKLIDKIRVQNPDFILLAGDINDEFCSTEASILLFEGIREIAPAYYVPGNHEYRSKKAGEYMELARSYGVTVLEDDLQTLTVRDMSVMLGGVVDPEKQDHDDPGYDPQQAMQDVFGQMGKQDDIYQILLTHRPEKIDWYARFPFDLVVSGHAHGGQVRIPFLLKNGLLAPNQGLFPKYTGGLYAHENFTHIVSRGLSVYIFPRVYNPPEVVSIHIISDQDE